MSVSLSLKNICRRFIKDNEEFLAVNNVNLEEEGMSALNNQLRYEMMTYSVSAMFNNIRTALTSR